MYPGRLPIADVYLDNFAVITMFDPEARIVFIALIQSDTLATSFANNAFRRDLCAPDIGLELCLSHRHVSLILFPLRSRRS